VASIYYAIRIVALLYILMTFFILASGGKQSDKNDRFSRNFIMITMGCFLPIIGYSVDGGVTAPGAFTWGFPFISYTGFLLILLGLVIHFTGIFTLGKRWSTVADVSEDRRLVDIGIYKYIRHPIYAGLLLEYIGFGVALANWITILVLFVPFTSALGYRIYVEEQALRESFGDAYISYARKTKRLIPGVF
jgi:protein-S-isoprenylcysteine O-methyltransferase Ste14